MRPGSAGKRPVAEDAPRHDESVGLRTAPSTRGPARALAGRCCRRSHKRAGDRFDRRSAAPGARRSLVQQNGSMSEADPIGCCCSLISNREPPTAPACSAPPMAPLTTRRPSAPPPAKQHRDVRRGSACEREQVGLVSDHRGVVPPDRSRTQGFWRGPGLGRHRGLSSAFMATRVCHPGRAGGAEAGSPLRVASRSTTAALSRRTSRSTRRPICWTTVASRSRSDLSRTCCVRTTPGW
jgi:hypothetical protein